jgi:hypothetical protein
MLSYVVVMLTIAVLFPILYWSSYCMKIAKAALVDMLADLLIQ